MNELSDALADRSSRLAAAQESAEEAKRAVKAVASELEACRREASDCRSSLDDRESTVREVRADCERLIASLKTVRDTLHTRDMELARLQKALAQLEAERDQLLARIDDNALVLKVCFSSLAYYSEYFIAIWSELTSTRSCNQMQNTVVGVLLTRSLFNNCTILMETVVLLCMFLETGEGNVASTGGAVRVASG